MRVKSRKPQAENLMTSRCVSSSSPVGGADDGVGDQVRQVRGDGQHLVVMHRLHRLDHRAHPAPELRQLAGRRFGRPPGSGVRMVQRPSNSSAKPAAGPECSVPAIGWPGMKCTCSGTSGPQVAQHRLLDRADIGEDRAGLAGAARSPGRPRHRRRSARRPRRGRRPSRLRAGSASTDSPSLSSAATLRASAGLRAMAMCLRQPVLARGAGDRRADQADADDRDPVEERLAHCVAAPFTKSSSASAQALTAASSGRS